MGDDVSWAWIHLSSLIYSSTDINKHLVIVQPQLPLKVTTTTFLLPTVRFVYLSHSNLRSSSLGFPPSTHASYSLPNTHAFLKPGSLQWSPSRDSFDALTFWPSSCILNCSVYASQSLTGPRASRGPLWATLLSTGPGTHLAVTPTKE